MAALSERSPFRPSFEVVVRPQQVDHHSIIDGALSQFSISPTIVPRSAVPPCSILTARPSEAASSGSERHGVYVLQLLSI